MRVSRGDPLVAKTALGQIMSGLMSRAFFGGRLAVVSLLFFLAVFSYTRAGEILKPQIATAATSDTINFQARLLTSAGNTVPDGNYSIEFKLYTADTGGSPVWTETRNSVGVNQVRVVNGYMTVNLGSVTAFSGINWDQQHWLTMNIYNPSTPGWDGEMSPRLKLTAVPYAFTAGQLAKTDGSGNRGTLGFNTVANNPNILLPDESGTVCIQSSSACGFLTSLTGVQLQGSTPGTQQTGNINISGTGIFGSNVDTNEVDTNYLIFGNENLAAIQKYTTAGSTGVGVDDLVILADESGSARAITTTTPRDQRIYGISQGNASSGVGVLVTVSGTAAVHVDTAEVKIGDQLVASSSAGRATVDNSATTGILGIARSPKAGGSNGSVTVDIRVASGQYSPTFRNGTDSTTAFQIQNALGSSALTVGTSPLNSLVTNGSAEGSSISAWSSKQNATVTRDTTQAAYLGGASIKTVLGGTTAIGDGVKYILPSSIGAGTYSLSFYIEQTAGTAFGANLQVGYNNGSDNNCTLAPSTQTVPTTGWARFTCTFTTTGTTTYLYWKQADAPASARTFFIDAVQLETGSTANPFKETTLQINGAITSAVTLQNAADSTTAFQIQNATGTNTLFVADTLNNQVGINMVPIGAGGSTLQVGGSVSISSYISAAQVLGTTEVGLGSGGDTTSGYITKRVTVGSTGNNLGDVVVMAVEGGVEKTIQTSIPRDPRVYGVSISTWPAGASPVTTVVYGSVTLNVDTAAVAVGDQLVTSSSAGRATVDNNATTGIIGKAQTAKAGGSNGTITAFVDPVSGQSNPVFRPASQFNVSGTTYNTGTITQSTTTITGAGGATFTPAMSGGTIYYADGTNATVTYLTSTTLSAPSKTIGSAQSYYIVYGGLNVGPTGNVTLQASSNSTAAFQIQNAAGSSVLNVDTTNTRAEVTADLYSAGLKWTSRTSPTSNWSSLAYGNGNFVAVSNTGDVMTSPDGIKWTSQTASAANSWNGVVYGNGLFVAVASSGAAPVMTSPDGINWTSRTPSAGSGWNSVAYGKGLFVAVSSTGVNGVITSPDGINWTPHTVTSNTWSDVTYGNGLFVAVGSGTSGVMTSSDGISWSNQTTPNRNYGAVTYGNGLFVAVSNSGSGNVITSPDGTTWTSQTTVTSSYWNEITYGNGLFVAVSDEGTGGVMTSTNGINWTARTPISGFWFEITYANGIFVSTGVFGSTVMTSGSIDSIGTPNNNSYQGGISVYGSSIFRSDTNSPTAFQIQNAAGASLFNIDSTNSVITLNGSNNGETRTWSTNGTSLSVARTESGNATANGYVYVVGGYNGSASVNSVLYAKVNADGSIGTWNCQGTTVAASCGVGATNVTNSNALPAARSGPAVVVLNGYIYAMGGSSNGGVTVLKTVYRAKLNADGSTGAWTSGVDTDLPAIRANASAIAMNGYIYVLGGNDGSVRTNTIYYTKPDTSGKISSWTTSSVNTPFNSINDAENVVTDNGYLYMFGGAPGNAPVNGIDVNYTRPIADGSFPAWTTQTAPLPGAKNSAAVVVVDGYVYVYGGNTGGTYATGTNNVYYSKLNADGSTAASWSTSANTMPAALSGLGQEGVTVNGYMYALGGVNTSNTAQTGVYYTSIPRTKISGSLDLIDANGQNFSGSSSGGSLRAGNTEILGQLNVRGSASVGQGLTVGDTLTVGGAATFQNATNSATAFQIQNAGGSQLLNVDTSTTPNLLANNADFEGSSVGSWVGRLGTETIARTASPAYQGNASLSVTEPGSSAANSGVKYVQSLSATTTYALSAYVKTQTGSISTFEIGRAENGATDTSCLTGQTVTSTSWTRLTCTFTTGDATPSSPYIYIKDTAGNVNKVWYVDNVQLEAKTNLLTNPGVEATIGSEWAAASASNNTVSRATSGSFNSGSARLDVNVTGTGTNMGAKAVVALSSYTTYTFSIYAKNVTSTASTMEIGRSEDGSTFTPCATNQGINPNNFVQLSCTFTTGATSGSTFVYIRDTASRTAASPSFSVDSAQLFTGTNTSATAFQNGTIALNGVINSPVAIRAQSDSSSTFQIQNASGFGLFGVDSLNSAIILGGDSNTTRTLTVRGGAATGTNTQGGNLTFDASNGTGAAGSGDLIFRTASQANPVTFDRGGYTDSGGSATATLTWSNGVVVSSGHSNNLLMVTLAYGQSATRTISGVTYNGTSMTMHSRQTFTCVSAGSATNCAEEIWYLVNPTADSAAHNVVVSVSGGTAFITAGYSSYYNVDQTTPLMAPNVTNGSSGGGPVNFSNTVTTTSVGQVPYGVLASDQIVNPVPTANQAERYNRHDVLSLIGDDSSVTTPGTTTFTWNTDTDVHAWLGTAINPASSTTADTMSERLRITAAGTLQVTSSQTIQTTTNSTTAFQIQNSGGAQLLNVDTTNLVSDLTTNSPANIVTNGSFEGTSAITGWSSRTSTTSILSQSSSQKYVGNNSLSVTTTATANAGAKYALSTTTLATSTQYTLTLSAKLASTTSAPNTTMSTLAIGHSRDGTTGNESSCLTAQTITSSGWTTLTCTFTTGTTSSTPYIYIKQTDGTARTFYIDGVQLTRSWVLQNYSIESAIAGNWTAKGTPTTHAQSAAQAYVGSNSLQVVTQATANQGTKQAIALNDNTTYSLTFYALGSGTALTTMEAGYSSDGVTDDTPCITGQSVSTSVWNAYTCTFTTPNGHSSGSYIYIKNTAATVRTVFLDNIQLTTGNVYTAYREGTISLNGIIVSPSTFQNQTNSTTAFQIQNAAGGNLFQVDTINSNVTINGGNSGMVQAWQTGNASGYTGTDTHGLVIANGYMYIIGGVAGGSTSSAVQYAKINSNGNVGNWTTLTNTPLPAVRNDGSAVFANGYIYYTGGTSDNTQAGAKNTVYYAKVKNDGTLGAWVTSSNPLTISGGTENRFRHTSIAYNGYLYVMGGSDTSSGKDWVMYSKLNADGSNGPWIRNNNNLTTITGRGSTAVANGYVYVLGGDNSTGTRVQYAKLNADGTVGSWATATSLLPVARYGAGIAVLNGNVYVFGGDNNLTGGSAVRYTNTYFAPLNSDGNITSTWSCQGSSSDCGGATDINGTAIPVANSGYANTVASSNGYIYAVGGWNGSSQQSTVYYTSTARNKVDGSLDLVGDNGENNAEGGTGGELTAGNTNIIGNLGVRGSATVGQGLSIGGELTVGSSATIQNSANSSNAFTIQNASGVSNFNVTTVNLIGNTTFEKGTTGQAPEGWTTKGTGSTITNSTTQALIGSSSMSVVTTGTNNAGAQYNFALLASTQYTLSFYARTSSGSYTITAGRQDAGSDGDCTGSSFTTTWTRFTCTFTTASTISGTPNIYFKDTSNTHTFYIDGIQLETAAAATTYTEGNIKLDGQITFKNSADSSNAFQVQNAAGNSVATISTSSTESSNFLQLGKDSTLNGRIVFNNSTNSNTVTLASGVTSSSYSLSLPTGGPGTGQCLKTDVTTASQLVFGSCTTGSGGTLASSYTAGTSQTDNTILLDSTRLGLIIQDATAGPISGNLFTIQKNAGGSQAYFAVSASAVTLQDTAGNNALVFDSTTSELRVYENATTPSNYASISYASGAAIFAASSGTTQLGQGTGTITLALSGLNDQVLANKTYTTASSSTYTNNDFKLTRNLAGGTSSNLQGSVVTIEDLSSIGSGGTSTPNVLYVNQNNGSATGNLILAQTTGSSTKFSVSTAGNVTAAGSVTATSGISIGSSQSYTGSGAVTLSSGGATALTLQSGGAAAVNVDTGAGAAINIGATNATSIVVGGNTSATITAKVANSASNAFLLQTAGGTSYLSLDTSTNKKLQVGSSTTDGTAILTVLDSYNTTDPTGTNGGMYYSTSTNTFRCYENNAWKNCLSAWQTITKSSDEVINSDATLSDDGVLKFTTVANTKYSIRLKVFYNAGNATADFKYRMAHTGTTTSVIRYITSAAGDNLVAEQALKTAFDASDVALTDTAFAPNVIFEDIVLQVGASGGQVSFQWAQNTSTAASNTTVFAGSYLEYVAL